jgi:hypothetical protein
VKVLKKRSEWDKVFDVGRGKMLHGKKGLWQLMAGFMKLSFKHAPGGMCAQEEKWDLTYHKSND